MICAFLQEALEAAGFEVRTACDAAAALDIIRACGGCEVALIDVLMPNMNGFELARRLRRENVAIIHFTGDRRLEDQLSPPDLFLFKPFRIAEAVSAVREALRRRSGSGGDEANVEERQGAS